MAPHCQCSIYLNTHHLHNPKKHHLCLKKIMATAVSACENKVPQKKKPVKFSKSEIEAAKQLIQLSSSSRDSEEEQEGEEEEEEDRHSSNNSFSYSVVQGNAQEEDQSTIKAPDTGYGDVSSVAAATAAEEDVLAEDESITVRNNKRYRLIEDLYIVTVPVPAGKPKKVIKSRK